MHQQMFRSAIVIGLCAVLAAACADGVTAPDLERRIGIIEGGVADAVPIALPDTVARGTSITVPVRTFGSGSCTRPDGATVEGGGLAVEIVPWDLWHTTGVCTDDLASYTRDVTLHFDVSGEALVRVLGVALVGRDPVQFEARVTVLP